jgi:hypothetical protein
VFQAPAPKALDRCDPVETANDLPFHEMLQIGEIGLEILAVNGPTPRVAHVANDFLFFVYRANGINARTLGSRR